MPPIHDLLKELDRAWQSSDAERINLRIIGSTALMLQADYQRGTKDSDVLETADLNQDTRTRLVELAGPGTDLHRRNKLYIEIVSSGLPLLPQVPSWLDIPELNRELTHFRVEVLHVLDVVVSKLRRFHGNDVRDIEAMVNLDLVSHAALIERFRAAVDCFSMDSRAEDLPRCVKNLHRVERDLLLVDETPIALPGWLQANDD